MTGLKQFHQRGARKPKAPPRPRAEGAPRERAENTWRYYSLQLPRRFTEIRS